MLSSSELVIEHDWRQDEESTCKTLDLSPIALNHIIRAKIDVISRII
jgi:hypothetical protein